MHIIIHAHTHTPHMCDIEYMYVYVFIIKRKKEKARNLSEESHNLSCPRKCLTHYVKML